ncbi:S-adenosyl-L-methionine-dependent methyltransferase [Syncephalis plumigaleata]|nr:S-adenosyl-L-methionine-dependent methyltransferase [Syncephalis plumigaleata]
MDSFDKSKNNLLSVRIVNPFAIDCKRKKSLSSTSDQSGYSCYLLPTNIHESERLNKQHEFLRMGLKTNHFAPIHHPRKVLDVGTGTAIWIKDMARLWPSSKFYAMDLIHPGPQDVKFKFAFADLLTGLPYSSKTFDYVHQRFLSSAIPTNKWMSVLEELYRVTRPGGYLEIVDTNVKLSTVGPITGQIFALITNMMSLGGIDLELVGNELGLWLTEVGFELVEKRIGKVPVGEWGGKTGQMCFNSWCLLIRSLKDKLLASNSLRSWDFELLMSEWQAEIEEINTSCEMVIYVARRPLKA